MYKILIISVLTFIISSCVEKSPNTNNKVRKSSGQKAVSKVNKTNKSNETYKANWIKAQQSKKQPTAAQKKLSETQRKANVEKKWAQNNPNYKADKNEDYNAKWLKAKKKQALERQQKAWKEKHASK